MSTRDLVHNVKPVVALAAGTVNAAATSATGWLPLADFEANMFQFPVTGIDGGTYSISKIEQADDGSGTGAVELTGDDLIGTEYRSYAAVTGALSKVLRLGFRNKKPFVRATISSVAQNGAFGTGMLLQGRPDKSPVAF